MAKVTMPLGSAIARGQLAKIMVFFPWKGINAVRGYVVPANPNTAAQQAQRAILHAGVDMWHATLLDAEDKTAWNMFATIFANIMSGFNTFIKKYVDAAVAGLGWVKVWDVNYTYTAPTTATIDCDTTSTLSVLHLKWGTSKTFMPNIVNGVGGATQTFLLTGLTVGVVYYYQIYDNVAGAPAWTGIYRKLHHV